MTSIRKYPRTPHIEGSNLQVGDDDLQLVPFKAVASRHLVVEEKMDGANAALSFDVAGELRLQSRGHFLTGGLREKHFSHFKTWAHSHRQALFRILGTRFVLYGEWLFAKHTIYYDRLPHYFLEFDILNVETDEFLSTPRRHQLLARSPVTSVPVLHSGPVNSLAELESLVSRSLYKSRDWKEHLRSQVHPEHTRETDPSDDAEGLYIKWEDDRKVLGRYKWVRSSFLDAVQNSGSHWLQRPIVPNGLAPHIDLPDLFEVES